MNIYWNLKNKNNKKKKKKKREREKEKKTSSTACTVPYRKVFFDYYSI